MKQGC